ncbi:hypothetical protein BDQ12DRAFT_650639 [Crucibulum laeve]|uniref:DUF6533 domain-containing protein n=1 Tax=Crucibulum laeve TaxID=68775 RepID=A0A5C3M0T9_9AGAR|nr:hypothetical protein BDQ12DRAFT_650639 [Crucibulum laeve]
MQQHIPSIIPDISETINTNYVGFASFTVLIWDHIDTFADEVEYIWKGPKKGLFVYLFLLNRYVTPLGFILNLFAYLSPSWTFERCARFVRYEGCTVSLAVEVVGLMMLLRIKAIYPEQKWISWGLGILLLFETVMNIWLISRAGPVLHNPHSGIHACSMIFDPAISAAASSSAWIPLLYDTIIFGLTLYRTVPPIRREEASYIIKRLLEDGLLYYSVIFSVTLVLTIMILSAPSGTKNIAAQTEQLITVAMMSRITLNLKKAGRSVEERTFSRQKTFLFDRLRRRRQSTVDGLEHPSFALSFPNGEDRLTNQTQSIQITFAGAVGQETSTVFDGGGGQITQFEQPRRPPVIHIIDPKAAEDV